MRAPVRCVTALAFVLLSTTAAAGTIFVNGALTTGGNDGSTWANALRGPDAVAVALGVAVPGDQIWVARGTYVPTTGSTRTSAHRLVGGVALYGGYAGTETHWGQRDWIANPTILSGDIGVPGVTTDNVHHVVIAAGTTVDETAILDGFTVTGGRADVVAGTNDRGAGLLCFGGSAPQIRRTRFVANHATARGGGAYVVSSSATFADVAFEDNSAAISGGALACANTSAVNFDRCRFARNSAARGGALDLVGAGGKTVANALFHDNVSTGAEGGGAIHGDGQIFVLHCTVVDNLALVHGTAGLLFTGGMPWVTACILWDNRAPDGFGATHNQISGAFDVTYSMVRGGLPGTGNLAGTPAFLAPAADDYRLGFASSAIDATSGYAASWAGGSDVDVKPRAVDEPSVPNSGLGDTPYVDMGCYEFPQPLVESVCHGNGGGVPCPCGNEIPNGALGGCRNSLGTGGLLGGAGLARISADSFALQGSGMTNSSCLYFQGTATLNVVYGTPFGDGIRCAGGSVIRLGTQTNTAGASQYPSAGDPSISARGAIVAPGSVRTYQCWYRNAAVFCTPSTFNLTNGVRVTWEL
jgi:predicted outer membrane repeat protein